MVATDVAARGIDVDDITHIFNYDLSHEPETHVHRIGRTARAGASGAAISFCDRDERAYLKAIEKMLGQAIEVRKDQPVFAPQSTVAERAPARQQRQASPARPARAAAHAAPARSTGQRPAREATEWVAATAYGQPRSTNAAKFTVRAGGHDGGHPKAGKKSGKPGGGVVSKPRSKAAKRRARMSVARGR
jgi:ATP-dependent RNA helicase RhlE